MTVYGLLDESAFKPYIHNGYSHTKHFYVMNVCALQDKSAEKPYINTD